ncbi:glycosyltransferase family 29 protein [Bradyrhizobium sp. USDA 223]|uniref:glycosyltransferase family 29 protein n=1 Tax=Bradyrhizobium sp. USDA 223 TaxID=3156306 RepID=UPI003834C3C2
MRIAIVGNGGGPLKMKLGPLIDGCDRVVRINEFRTNGYEESVGSRLDIHMVNSWTRIAGRDDQWRTGQCLWFAFPDPVSWTRMATEYEGFELEYLTRWHLDFLPEEASSEIHARALEAVVSGPVQYFSQSLMIDLVRAMDFERAGIMIGKDGKVVQPTTGLKALSLARHLYPDAELLALGFDGFQSSTYYWDPQRADQYDNHAYAREVDYFSQLVQRGAITRLDVRAP